LEANTCENAPPTNEFNPVTEVDVPIDMEDKPTALFSVGQSQQFWPNNCETKIKNNKWSVKVIFFIRFFIKAENNQTFFEFILLLFFLNRVKHTKIKERD
jgi:hypothetical protein